MNKNDLDEFIKIWKAASAVYNINLTDEAIGLSFQVLSRYELPDIRKSLSSFLSSSQFAPKPADIVNLLASSDGRPTADEAWSIAIDSFDEYKTVVMNDEISTALTQAQGIYNDGDKVGARMAFKAAYERNISVARAEGLKPKWWPSIGFDVQGRRPALEKAVINGLLEAKSVNHLLPAPLQIDPSKLLADAKKEIAHTESSEAQ